MKVTREKTENRQAFLTIEPDREEVDASIAEAYEHMGKKANIPGFRKGKAPRAVLERFLDKTSVLEHALGHLWPEVYERALKEENIEPIAEPHVHIESTDPVIFKAEVPLPPVVELGDYHGISVSAEEPEAVDEQVDKIMEELRHERATWEPVERPLALDDLAIFDIESSVGGEPFVNQKDAQYQLASDSPFPAPGFAEQLVGMNKNEEKEFTIQFPDDYATSELAGKEASFKVKLSEIKQEVLPELTDELAKEIIPDIDSVAALRERIFTNLKRHAEERVRRAFEEKAVQALVDVSTVEFPPTIVEFEIDHMIQDQARQLRMDGRSLEEYLQRINKTEDEVREELRPLAATRITSALVLNKLTEAENISVENPEIDAEIEAIIESATDRKEDLRRGLNTETSRTSMRRMLVTRKTMARLAELAGGKGNEKKEEDK
ncbi:MAG: trigger factor [Chloroflexi bacterium]|nr:trigger factor [Chloroflexota bacterium]